MDMAQSDVVDSVYYQYLLGDKKHLPPSATPQGVPTENSLDGVLKAVYALAKEKYRKRIKSALSKNGR
jgi:hypothetical protein